MSHRMQITLEDEQYAALVSESERTGASMAELIRQTLDERFSLGSADARADRFRQALHAAAGSWADRHEDGLAYQQRVRASLAARPAVSVSGSGSRRRAG